MRNLGGFGGKPLVDGEQRAPAAQTVLRQTLLGPGFVKHAQPVAMCKLGYFIVAVAPVAQRLGDALQA